MGCFLELIMVVQKGLLERQAELYRDISVDRIRTVYSENLGVFFESTTKPRFTPIVPAPLLMAWVRRNARDPLHYFLFPPELHNSYNWAKKQVEKHGIAVVAHEISVPEEQACRELGYNPYHIYGTDEAAKHLLASLRSRIVGRLPDTAGSKHISEILKDTLDKLML